ncbi:PPC domain-containing DNA-binding protein [Halocatena halophila]|uniref:PPC domain-containing DNA-binding protein n=1 Tax=Halocatena halophila TaxID=2814576 RepID=UPI002ED1259D
MEHFSADDGTVVVRLDRDEPILESLRRVCSAHGIDTGVVLSGIATVQSLPIHYVDRTTITEDREDRNTMVTYEGAWEINSIGGVIADGEPHLHITGFDGERTVAGHLEEGCLINVLGEFTLTGFDGLELTRTPDENGISKLTEQ